MLSSLNLSIDYKFLQKYNITTRKENGFPTNKAHRV